MSAHEAWRCLFSSWNDAETYLAERGFSLGRMQGPSPRGILLGRWDIQKFRNLSAAEKKTLHGFAQRGPGVGSLVAVRIFDGAPAEAHEAIRQRSKAATSESDATCEILKP